MLSQKNLIKAKETENIDMEKYNFEEFETKEHKDDTFNFLKEIRDYYEGLNMFTDVLINFGTGLKYIERGSIFDRKIF